MSSGDYTRAVDRDELERLRAGPRTGPRPAQARLDVAASRAAWRAARTFADLCACSARFLAGELAVFPGWNADVLDEESEPLRARLVRWNRCGLLTTASQPAGPSQHAFVCGFARRETADRLASHDGRDDLRVLVFADGLDTAAECVPVSFHAGVPHAFAGHDAREDEIVCFEDHVSVPALAALRAAAFVHAWDARIGREDVLWRALDDATETR